MSYAAGHRRQARCEQPRHELTSTYLHHPHLAASLLPFEQCIASDSLLPARHRALLGLRTAWLMGSEYLWAHRAAAASADGLTDAELRRATITRNSSICRSPSARSR